MRRSLLSTALVAALVLPALALAEGTEKFHMMTVPEVAQLLKEKKVTPVDANNPETRAKFGVIPGATLLASFDKFDPSKDLPTDKSQKLVFYCANTRCMASHHAADKAIGAGYKDVNVLSAGIAGWKDAGQATAPAPKG
jgi:rhodanese-related sulfurtransferase